MSFIFSLVLFFAYAEVTVPPQAPPGAEQQELEVRIESMKSNIETLNTNLSCVKKEDCAFVGLGQKLCGGPEYNVVVSKKNPQYSIIVSEAKNHQTLRRQYNEQYAQGMMGHCSMAPFPALACRKKLCVDLNAD